MVDYTWFIDYSMVHNSVKNYILMVKNIILPFANHD